ncbi:MAG TPA: hypothetical protein VEA69_25640 [Tepidisphaeraceae bacterium]|nr:hypothetical protein [Tepidisphaeraceae bacterium]
MSRSIFVQNGEELSKHADYLAVTNGIGHEDTWYDGNEPNNRGHQPGA